MHHRDLMKVIIMSQMSSSALINKGEVAVKRETHWTLLNAPESHLNLNGVAEHDFCLPSLWAHVEQWSRSAERTQWLREGDNPELIVINSFACGLYIVWNVNSGNNETNCPLVNFIDLLPIIIRVRPCKKNRQTIIRCKYSIICTVVVVTMATGNYSFSGRRLCIFWIVRLPTGQYDKELNARACTGSRGEEERAEEERGGVIEWRWCRTCACRMFCLRMLTISKSSLKAVLATLVYSHGRSPELLFMGMECLREDILNRVTRESFRCMRLVEFY